VTTRNHAAIAAFNFTTDGPIRGRGPEGLTAVADQVKFLTMHERVWHYQVAKMLPVFQHRDEFGID
jgi:hypothetical protein